jgi:hypothetical protein
VPSPEKFTLNIRSLKHLSYNLNTDQDLLTYYCINKEKHVDRICLKQNRHGIIKERTVYNTSDVYKQILRKFNKQILQKFELPVGVLGAVLGKSIDDMASFHTKKEAVFSIDLKDFFPSISSGRIFNLFLSAGCTHKVSEVVTDLVTFKGALPQGYPTSPMLANIVALNLDFDHIQFCSKNQLSRTRWIDDIVISGRTKDLTPQINHIVGAVKKNGFKTSNRKTKFKHRSEHPQVLGLDVTNDNPRVPQVVVRKVECLLLDCLDFGTEMVELLYNSDDIAKHKNLAASLKGKIDFIQRYNPNDAIELRRLFSKVFS